LSSFQEGVIGGKFNKGRTSVRGSLEGLEEYERTIQAGTLREVTVYPCVEREVRGVWEKLRLEEFAWREKSSQEPLEVLAMRIRPRCLPVDELTRHPNTDQVFIRVTGAFLAVAGSSSSGDQNNPDPASLDVIPVALGGAINIKAGAWHTLPFATTQDLVCLSVTQRQDLDSYHDLRDLTAAGWSLF